GNVGIGTTNPANFRLQVAGSIGPNATNSYNLGGTGNNWGCLYYNNGQTGTCASDARLKTNVADIVFGSDPLAQLSGLRLRTFSFISDNTDSMYNGLIAQEVEQVAPELVVTSSDGYKAVKYGDIQWLTVAAIQELNTHIGPMPVIAGVLGLGADSNPQCVTGDTRLRRRRRRRKGGETGADVEDDFEEIFIKDILPGDEIMSLDEEKKRVVYAKVNALLDMGVQEIYELTTSSGRKIRTTKNHPYLVRISKS
ncbi:MAG: tail fiber domain-containing protein, partial [bacterium]